MHNYCLLWFLLKIKIPKNVQDLLFNIQIKKNQKKNSITLQQISIVLTKIIFKPKIMIIICYIKIKKYLNN